MKYWSGEVTQKSNALDLENSLRRKADPYQSAMGMLNFYINRAGKNVKRDRKRVLEQAKGELKKLFNPL